MADYCEICGSEGYRTCSHLTVELDLSQHLLLCSNCWYKYHTGTAKYKFDFEKFISDHSSFMFSSLL